MAKFDIVQAWLDGIAYSHSNSPNTAIQYKFNLQKFLEFVDKTPEQILEEYKKTDDRTFKRTYGQYLRGFISSLSTQNLVVSTISARITAVKSFFHYNDLPLGFVPLAKVRVVFHNRDITEEEVRKILAASKPRDKAFYCMMAQTGIRPDTLCKLRLEDIEPDFSKGVVPCRVNVPRDKTKGQYREYFSFMGKESVDYLKTYLQRERPGILPEDLLFSAYGSKKPASAKSFSVIFARTIQHLNESKAISYKRRVGDKDITYKKKSGKTYTRTAGKPSELRLYNLRKFFRKYAHQAGFEIVQFWMGHSVSAGVDDHYRPTEIEFHRKLYAETAMPFLRMETATPNETDKVITSIARTHSEYDQRIKTLEEELKRLKKFMRGKELSDEELSKVELV